MLKITQDFKKSIRVFNINNVKINRSKKIPPNPLIIKENQDNSIETNLKPFDYVYCLIHLNMWGYKERLRIKFICKKFNYLICDTDNKVERIVKITNVKEWKGETNDT